jgi:aminobenzoyl-glutamate utilization protein B
MPEWSEQEQMFARSLQKELGVKETGYNSKPEPLKVPAANDLDGSSTDVGEVTLVSPTATVLFPGEVPGSIGHHWSVVTGNYGSAAWKGLNTGARVIAATAVDLLTQPVVLREIRKEFEEQSKEHPYKSFLPEGAKPPLYLNRELMDKYREALIQAGQAEH